jgi:hypothetical protein
LGEPQRRTGLFGEDEKHVRKDVRQRTLLIFTDISEKDVTLVFSI